MPITVAQLEARLTVDDRDLRQGLERDQQLLEGFSAALRGVSRTIAALTARSLRSFRADLRGVGDAVERSATQTERAATEIQRAAAEVERAFSGLGATVPQLQTSGIEAPLHRVQQQAKETQAAVSEAVSQTAPRVDTGQSVSQLKGLGGAARDVARVVQEVFAATRPQFDFGPLNARFSALAARVRALARETAQTAAHIRFALPLGPVRAGLLAAREAARHALAGIADSFARARLALNWSSLLQGMAGIARAAGNVAGAVQRLFSRIRLTLPTRDFLLPMGQLPRVTRETLSRVTSSFSRLTPSFDLRRVTGALARLPHVARVAAQSVRAVFDGVRPVLSLGGVVAGLERLATAARGAGLRVQNALRLRATLAAAPVLQSLAAVRAGAALTRDAFARAAAAVRAAFDVATIARGFVALRGYAADAARAIGASFAALRPQLNLQPARAGLVAVRQLANDVGGAIAAAFRASRARLDFSAFEQSLRRLRDGAGGVARAVRAVLSWRVRLTTEDAERALSALASRAASTLRAVGNLFRGFRPSFNVDGVVEPLRRAAAAGAGLVARLRAAFTGFAPRFDFSAIRSQLLGLGQVAGRVGRAIASAFTGGGPDTRGIGAAFAAIADAARRAGVAARQLFAGMRPTIDLSQVTPALQSLERRARATFLAIRTYFSGLRPVLRAEAVEAGFARLMALARTTLSRIQLEFGRFSPRPNISTALNALTTLTRAARAAGATLRQVLGNVRPGLVVEPLLRGLGAVGAVATHAAARARAAFATLAPRLDVTQIQAALAAVRASAGRAARAVATAFSGGRFDAGNAGAAIAAIGAAAVRAAQAVGSLFDRIRPRVSLEQPVAALQRIVAAVRRAVTTIQSTFSGLRPRISLEGIDQALRSVPARIRSITNELSVDFGRLRPRLDLSLIERGLTGAAVTATRSVRAIAVAFSSLRDRIAAGGLRSPGIDLSGIGRALRELPARATDALRAVQSIFARWRPSLSLTGAHAALRLLLGSATATARGMLMAFRRVTLLPDLGPAQALFQRLGATVSRVAAMAGRALSGLRARVETGPAITALEALLSASRRVQSALAGIARGFAPRVEIGPALAALRALASGSRAAMDRIRRGFDLSSLTAGFTALVSAARDGVERAAALFRRLRLNVSVDGARAALRAVLAEATRTVTLLAMRFRALVLRLEVGPFTRALATARVAMATAVRQVRTTLSGWRLSLDTAAGRAAIEALVGTARRARNAMETFTRGIVVRVGTTPAREAFAALVIAARQSATRVMAALRFTALAEQLRALPETARGAFQALSATMRRLRPTIDTSAIVQSLRGVAGVAATVAGAVGRAFYRQRLTIAVGGMILGLQNVAEAATRTGGLVQSALSGLRVLVDTGQATTALATLYVATAAAVAGFRPLMAGLRAVVETRAAQSALAALRAAATFTATRLRNLFGTLSLPLSVDAAVAALRALPGAAARVAGQIVAALAAVRPRFDVGLVLGSLEAFRARAGAVFAALRDSLAGARDQFRAGFDVTAAQRALSSLAGWAVATVNRVREAFDRVRLRVTTSDAGAALRELAARARATAREVGERFRRVVARIDVAGAVTGFDRLRDAAARVGAQIGSALASAGQRLRGAFDVGHVDFGRLTGALRELPALATRARTALAGAMMRLRFTPQLAMESFRGGLEQLVGSSRAAAARIRGALGSVSARVDTGSARTMFGQIVAAAGRATAAVRRLFAGSTPRVPVGEATASVNRLVDLFRRAGRDAGDGLRRGVEQGARAAGRAVDELGGHEGGIKELFGGGLILGLAGQVQTSLVQPVRDLMKGFFDAATQMDSFERSLTAVMGTGSGARAEMEKLREVAKMPGLGFPEALAGSQALQATGMAAEDTRKAIEGLGRAASTAKNPREDFAAAMVQLQQMLSVEKVLTEDLRIIRMHLPSSAAAIRNALQSFGVMDPKELGEAGVSASEFVKRLVPELMKLPVAASGVQNALDNLSDTLFQLKAEMGKPFAKEFEQTMQSLQPRLEQFAESLGKLSPQAKLFGSSFLTVGAHLLQGTTAFVGLRIAFQYLSKEIVAAGKWLFGFIPVLAGLNLSATGVIVTIIALVAAVTALIAAFVSDFGGIRTATVGVFRSLGREFRVVAEWIRGLGPVFANVWQAVVSGFYVVGRLLGPVWAQIRNIASAIGSVLGGALKGLVGLLLGITRIMLGDWKGGWVQIVDATGEFLAGIARAFGILLRGMRESWRDFWNDLGEFAANPAAATAKRLWERQAKEAGLAARDAGESWTNETDAAIARMTQNIRNGFIDGFKEPVKAKLEWEDSGYRDERAASELFKELQEKRAKAWQAANAKITESQKKAKEAFQSDFADVVKELAMLRAPDLLAQLRIKYDFQLPEDQLRALAYLTALRDREKEAIERTRSAAEKLRSEMENLAESITESAARLPKGLREQALGFARQIRPAPAAGLPVGPVGNLSQNIPTIEALTQQFNIQSSAMAALGTKFGRLGCARAVSSILSGAVGELEGLNEQSVSGLVKRLTGLGAEVVQGRANARVGDVAVFNRGVLGPQGHTGVVAWRGPGMGIVHNSTAAGHRAAFDPGLMGRASYFLRLPQGAGGAGALPGGVSPVGSARVMAATAGVSEATHRQAEALKALIDRYLEASKEIALYGAANTRARVLVEAFGGAVDTTAPAVKTLADALAERENLRRYRELLARVKEGWNEARVALLAATATTTAEQIALEQYGKSLGSLPAQLQKLIRAQAEFAQQKPLVEAATQAQREYHQEVAHSDGARRALELLAHAYDDLSPASRKALDETKAWSNATEAAKGAKQAADQVIDLSKQLEKLRAATSLQRASLELMERPLSEFAADLDRAAQATQRVIGNGGPVAELTRSLTQMRKASLAGDVREGFVDLSAALARVPLGSFRREYEALQRALASGVESEVAAAFSRTRDVVSQMRDAATTTSPEVEELWQRLKALGDLLGAAGIARDKAALELFRDLGRELTDAQGELATMTLNTRIEQRSQEVMAETLRQTGAAYVRMGNDIDDAARMALAADPKLRQLREELARQQVAAKRGAESWEELQSTIQAGLKSTNPDIVKGARKALDDANKMVDTIVRRGTTEQGGDTQTDRDRRRNEITRSLTERLAEAQDAFDRASFGAGTYGRALEQLNLRSGQLTREQQQMAQQIGETSFATELMGRRNEAMQSMEAATGAASRQVQILRDMGIEWERLTESQRAFAAGMTADILRFDLVRQFADGVHQIFDNLFSDLFHNGFKGFFSNVLQGFHELLGRMAAEYLASELRNVFFHAIGGLFGKGPVAKIAAAVGGARAEGGPVAMGIPYLVGERGPEVFVPRRNGTVLNADQLAAAGGGNTSVTIHVHGVQDVSGFRRAEAQIATEMVRRLEIVRRRGGG